MAQSGAAVSLDIGGRQSSRRKGPIFLNAGRIRRAALFSLWLELAVVVAPVFTQHRLGQPSLIAGIVGFALHYLADPEFERLLRLRRR